MIVVIDMLRRIALAEGGTLAASGRLDTPDQIFNLSVEECHLAASDESLDLRALTNENTRFLRKLRQVRQFPMFIDSRGRILRPPRKEAKAGEIMGVPISAGQVQGKVKVLEQPDEKPLLPGEILVARATDPGWTPLFLNAAGVILEIGGVLQHGALVAREYGKPCVAGIENATSVFADDMLVALDGAAGTVRIIQAQV